jgi:hypothetical protein
MEKTNDKRLTNAALLFVLMVVGVMLVQWWMAPSYSLTNEQVLEKINQESTLVLPYQLTNLSEDQARETTALFLMEESQLSTPAFKQQLFVPFGEILNSKKLSKINKNEPILIFGKTETQAMMALQLLVSKGYTQLRAVANDLSLIQQILTHGFDPATAQTKSEKAAFDYGRFFKTSGGAGKAAGPAAKIPDAVEVVKTAGGCS